MNWTKAKSQYCYIMKLFFSFLINELFFNIFMYIEKIIMANALA